MVMLLNYVDGDVPKWDSGDDDPLGVDVAALVVFHPDIKPRSFERSVMFLEDRCRTRVEMTIRHARPTNSHLKVIDAQTIAEASSSCAQIHGYDYLDQFVNDTLEVALEEVGLAVARARSQGVSVRPDYYANGITVMPARSFQDKQSLETWEAGGKANWIPSVRLQVELQLDGPFSLVEAACEDIRRAVAACGPLTFFEEHARLPLEVSGACMQVMELELDEPEVCA
jgi:hypothetical protein